jgi:hypothetical protein
MSSPGPKWVRETASTVPPEPPDGCASANACLPTNNKEEIEPQELLLLREFFLLLDEWDRQQER